MILFREKMRLAGFRSLKLWICKLRKESMEKKRGNAHSPSQEKNKLQLRKMVKDPRATTGGAGDRMYVPEQAHS